MLRFQPGLGSYMNELFIVPTSYTSATNSRPTAVVEAVEPRASDDQAHSTDGS